MTGARKRAAAPKPKTRLATKKRRKPASRIIMSRVVPRARRNREVVGMQCRVVEVHPDAEVLVLSEPLRGQLFTLPLCSFARDGRHVTDVARLTGHDVWLSLRVS